MDQNDLDTIATLVEEYVGQLSTAVQQALEELDTRLRSVEHVASTAIYVDHIRNEAIRLGIPVSGGVDGGEEVSEMERAFDEALERADPGDGND